MKYGQNTDGTLSNDNTGKPKGAKNPIIPAIEITLRDSVAVEIFIERIAPHSKEIHVSIHFPPCRLHLNYEIAKKYMPAPTTLQPDRQI